MKNIRIVLAYDGTHYFGWQLSKMGPTIEEVLQRVLEQIFQEKLHLQAASRTDAGVHAIGQVVNFMTSHAQIDLSQLRKSLNSLLPKDIAILDIKEEFPSFHPTLDCQGKEYHYFICNSPAQLPQNRLYSWHYSYDLRLELMRQASEYFIGEHDFSAFCNVQKNRFYDHKIRRISRIDIIPLPEQRFRVEIEGNHFLYKMVRNLVGTLVYVGRRLISLENMSEILLGKDRTKAGITAPAHGLFLTKIFYNE